MSAKNLIEYLENKKILLLGFGREGKSTYSFIRKYLPEKELTIGDFNNVSVSDENVKYICGSDYLEHLGEFDIVIKSPGIAFIGVSYPDTTEVTNQNDLFFRFCDCKTIGITGTKGKSTTSNLTAKILNESGQNAVLMGNIGLPVLNYIDLDKDSIAVVELSSHQLEFMKISPHVAVLTNVYEEHLDHYEKGFEGYVNAKLNIVRYQSEEDIFIYNGTQGISDFIDESTIKSEKLKVFAGGNELTAPLKNINKNLLGDHFLMDITYAATAAKIMGATDEAVVNTIKKYEGIPHRMEYVKTVDGVEFYNDAIATIPTAAINAIKALGNVGTLIVGGLDRGIDYSDFIRALSQIDLDYVLCLPDTGYKIADGMTALGSKAVPIKVSDMVQCVAKAKELTKSGKACLLSPAAASYNVYKDFEEKGNHYKSLI